MQLNIDYIHSINFALVNNGIAICKSFELTNNSNEDIRDVKLEYYGDFFERNHSYIADVIKVGESVRIYDIKIDPIPSKVASITEKTRTTFTIEVYSKASTEENKRVFSQRYTIDIMPYDQWLGTSIMPQYLASFVLPNDPTINSIIYKAAGILKGLSQSSSFVGYQTRNNNDVRKQIAAVFGALHAENIVYRPLIASFEDVGQRIALCNQVISSKLGNCIELTLLFASILESIDLNCGIIIQKGHAFLYVWLIDDCCQYSVYDDASYIEKKCANGIDEMLVLECTQITEEKTSFEDAQRIAEKNLTDHDSFEFFIDIHRCRLENVRPLPQTVEISQQGKNTLSDVEHDECNLDVEEHSRFDLSNATEDEEKSSRMDIWERKLLDFTLRNTMLNLSMNQRAIQLISFCINILEDYLQDGEEYMISSKPNIELDITVDKKLLRSKQFPKAQKLIIDDIKHHKLHTYLTETETRRTLKNIYRVSRSILEETGANSLFISIGVLRWYESDISKTPRYAPILMLPIDIVYKKGDYYIRMRDDGTVLNITLIEYIKRTFGVNIFGINPLPKDDHGIDVPLVFSLFRDAIKNKKGWDVEEESVLGIFSFNKFLMWNDLHSNLNVFLQNDIIRSLLEQKFIYTPQKTTEDLKDIDKRVSPDTLALPLPIDSSQLATVMAAEHGDSFIIYGPPGTGKSQTITNLIANALFHGKRVLFVAEKMAALSVVQQRLEQVGLAPFCMEMHSNKTTKRHVLKQLESALKMTSIAAPKEYAAKADLLFRQRHLLIDFIEALHDNTSPDGLSLYDCIEKYKSITAPELNIDVLNDELRANFRVDQLDNFRHILSNKYTAVLNLLGDPSQHSLLGLDIKEEEIVEPTLLQKRILSAVETMQQGLESLQCLTKIEAIKAGILTQCNAKVLEEDANALHTEWIEIKGKFFISRFFAKRKYLQKLLPLNKKISNADIETILLNITRYQQLHSEIQALQNVLQDFFSVFFTGDKLPTEEDLHFYTQKLNNWNQNLSLARDWFHWCEYKKELCNIGLNVVAQKIEEKPILADQLYYSFLKTMFKILANEKIAKSKILRRFEGSIFDETVSLYRKLAEDFQTLSREELRARLAANVQNTLENFDFTGELSMLKRNISNGGRGLPLRDLLDQVPNLLSHLCPCLLMSPMSVAKYLDPSHEKFDLVIFDEASQIPTCEAIGAIARGKSIVVVGDPKQMPPTSFFSSSCINEYEENLDDLESILEDCSTLGFPSYQLNWHYRSKHESLIAFSNNEYYDGELVTFPSTDDKIRKVTFNYIGGIYDRSGRRTNRKEAEAVVAEIVNRLSLPDFAEHSIGVIAFNSPQQNLIEDLLLEKLDSNKAIREASEKMKEPIFVKNLENVQGDERDIILFSIGYGPDAKGSVSLNFGPLNSAGGERRLNVAVSRAREEMIVYSSLKASQIDLGRTSALGVIGLKHFIEYAEYGIIGTPHNTTNVDVAISEQIAEAIRNRGYKTSINIGRSKFKVNIAISDPKNPDNYIVGILLDGKEYYATQTTRDREVVQPAVLKALDWDIIHIWSMDWFTNPSRVISHIENHLKKILDASA